MKERRDHVDQINFPREIGPRFWKGKEDIVIAETALVSARGAVVNVLVSKGAIPPVNSLADQERLMSLEESAKSRLIQLGFSPIKGASVSIAQALRRNMDNGRIPDFFTAQIGVTNHGVRPLRLHIGSPIFRLYRPGFRIQGEELSHYVSSGEIMLDGKQGRDWDYVKDDPSNPRLRTGIAIRIKQGERYWIPPHKDPIDTRQVLRSPDYREELKRYHKPIPIQEEPILWIGETRPIVLSQNVEALIDEDVAPNLSATGHPGRWGIHIESRLIDAGSGWPIRVEVKSPTLPDKIPNYAVFRFMHTDGRQAKPNKS